MENEERKLIEFQLLLDRLFDDEATKEEVLKIQRLIQKDPLLQQYYFRCVELKSGLHQLKFLDTVPAFLRQNYEDVLFEFAKYEKTAPTIEIPGEKTSQELIQKVVYPPRKKRKISTFSKVFLIMNTAAILFIVLFIRFMPTHGESYACVIEQYQAELQGTKSNYQVGQYLDDKLIKLEKGLLKIQMNDGSEILFEAPAEISLEDNDQLFLIQGKLTASVPQRAVGFTVRTPSASIIDYGTQFGVKVDRYAKTEAHVLKGNIKVGVGSNPRILEETLRLSANQAACISGQTLKIIPPETDQFVYDLPSSFERMATSLGASMYLCLQSDSIGSFRDVMGAVATKDIKIKPDLSVVPGPFSGGSVKSYAFRIEGSDCAIEVSSTQSIRQNPEGDYSIGCWVRFDEIKQQSIYSGRVDAQNTGFGIRSMLMEDNGALHHFAHDRELSGTAWSVSGADALVPGQWYFILISRDAGLNSRKDIYINGKRVASKSMEVKKKMIEKFDSFQFGANVGSYSGFEGELAEILLFPRALNSKEVQDLYESARTRPK